MDPSCTIGFYCKARSEFLDLREKAEKVLAPPLQKGVYPFFTFIDQRADDAFTDSFEQHLNSLSGHGATMTVSDPNASLSKRRKSGGKNIEDDFIVKDDDDFVIVEVKASSTPKYRGQDAKVNDDSVGEDSLVAAGFEQVFSKKTVARTREELVENGAESEVGKLGRQVDDVMILPTREGEELIENRAESEKVQQVDEGEELVENGAESEDIAELVRQADAVTIPAGEETDMLSQETVESMSLQDQLDAFT